MSNELHDEPDDESFEPLLPDHKAAELIKKTNPTLYDLFCQMVMMGTSKPAILVGVDSAVSEAACTSGDPKTGQLTRALLDQTLDYLIARL